MTTAIPISRPKTTILFLAANPSKTARLKLDVELREIQNGLERSQQREHIQLFSKPAARPRDVQRAIGDNKPDIIHFSGHGEGEQGLCFEGSQETPKLVSTQALASLFELYQETTQCVLLNACYSEVQAKAIATHIPYVIGMNKAIGDEAAIVFAVGFYDAIGRGDTIEVAFKSGRTALLMEDISEHLTPVLLANEQRIGNKKAQKAEQQTGQQNQSEDTNKRSIKIPIQLSSTAPQINPTPPAIPSITQDNNRPILWLSFHLKQTNNTITAHWKDHQQNTASQQLLPFIESESAFQTLANVLLGDPDNWQQQLQPELQQAGLERLEQVTLRIRIMTDDPQLAMLPWHKMVLSHKQRLIAETCPVIPHYQIGFHSQTIKDPLLVIPADQRHEIRGDSHYRLIQEYLHSYLDISGTTPRVRTLTQLKREIEFLEPDLIYLYGKYENGEIQLDQDFVNGASLTLNTLAEWVQEAAIKPIVILSLIGGEVFNYPVILIENSRLLWIQQAARETRIDDLGNNLVNILESLNNTADIVSSIVVSADNPKYDLKHHLWLNTSQSIQIERTGTPDKSKQLRAALLKVMLGRERQKKDVIYKIQHSETISKRSSLTYVMTGNEMSCPFDFPAQLQQQLQWHDIKNSLPVIPFYFHISIEEHRDASRTIDMALSQGLLHGNQDIGSIFQEEKEQRALQGQDCCISLNWLITVADNQHEDIQDWLKAWVNIIHTDFHQANIPENTVLVNAACLQIAGEVDYEYIQNIQRDANRTINRTIKKHLQGNLQNIRISEALGKLKEEEIEDFFFDNPHWREALKLDKDQIDLENYAEWVYQQKQGAFDDTVRLIWQQSQQEYQQYMNEVLVE
ncbi:MAG: CHAT domain-containing protein [Thiotrichaceae bacterium]